MSQNCTGIVLDVLCLLKVDTNLPRAYLTPNTPSSGLPLSLTESMTSGKALVSHHR